MEIKQDVLTVLETLGMHVQIIFVPQYLLNVITLFEKSGKNVIMVDSLDVPKIAKLLKGLHVLEDLKWLQHVIKKLHAEIMHYRQTY